MYAAMQENLDVLLNDGRVAKLTYWPFKFGSPFRTRNKGAKAHVRFFSGSCASVFTREIVSVDWNFTMEGDE